MNGDLNCRRTITVRDCRGELHLVPALSIILSNIILLGLASAWANQDPAFGAFGAMGIVTGGFMCSLIDPDI